MFSCRAVIDGMHGQAGDAQRGRTFQTVAQEGAEQESRRLGGGSGFGFIAGPGDEHGRQRRRCPLRERLREEEEIIVCRKSRLQKGTYCFHIYFYLQIRGLVWFLVWY